MTSSVSSSCPAGPCSGQPSGPTMTEQPRKRTSRSTPTRSAQATTTPFCPAVAMATMSPRQYPASLYTWRRNEATQLVGTAMISAPASASARAASGNQRSKQITMPTRPKGSSTTGSSPPGSNHDFSSLKRCSFRYVATWPCGPTTTALLWRTAPSRSLRPTTQCMPRRGADLRQRLDQGARVARPRRSRPPRSRTRRRTRSTPARAAPAGRRPAPPRAAPMPPRRRGWRRRHRPAVRTGPRRRARVDSSHSPFALTAIRGTRDDTAQTTSYEIVPMAAATAAARSRAGPC